jgi:hypothetical protein
MHFGIEAKKAGMPLDRLISLITAHRGAFDLDPYDLEPWGVLHHLINLFNLTNGTDPKGLRPIKLMDYIEAIIAKHANDDERSIESSFFCLKSSITEIQKGIDRIHCPWSFDDVFMIYCLEEFVLGSFRRGAEDIRLGMLDEIFNNPLLLKARILLAKEEYRTIAEAGREIDLRTLIHCLLLNKRNNIICQTSDLVLQYQGEKGVLKGMTSLAERISAFSFTKEDLLAAIFQSGFQADEREIENILKEKGFRYLNYEGKEIVVPVVYDCLLSAYRGGAQIEADARYLTHAITTAMMSYAVIGGEQGVDVSGQNAIHEYDLGQMMIENHDQRILDGVTLAFYYDRPLAEYTKKRTMILSELTMGGHISRLLEWQSKERLVKQKIQNTLKLIAQGILTTKALDDAISLIKQQLKILQIECGLNPEYFRVLYGCISSAFFNELQRKYAPGKNNRALLSDLLMKRMKKITISVVPENETAESVLPHPWLGVEKTLLDYFDNEEFIRKGTFDDVELSAA